MEAKVLRYCLQAIIVQSLFCVLIDAAPVVPTGKPWAVASSIPLQATIANAAAHSVPMNALPYSSGTARQLLFNAARLSASNGGGFTVTSMSPIAPTGVSILSENRIGGDLKVIGQAPFTATVALEGQVPSFGSGAINYQCGNGDIGIVSEEFINDLFVGGYNPIVNRNGAFVKMY